MNALKPQPPFQILIMSEESRLGRESIETNYTLKQILDAGVQVFYYLEDKEAILDSALDKMMVALTSFASEMEREKARQRTHDALARKAKTGYVTGGKVFGYDNVETFGTQETAEGKPHRLHVFRRINPDQAAIIRRIFKMYAEGKGIQRIAKTLNAERVLSPRLAHGWAPSAIREMLYRPLYKGQIVWNRRENIVRGGTKKRRKRPSSEWIQLEDPGLRIVPPELGEAVHQRLEKARKTYLRINESGRLMGRPTIRDFDSPYLLSGLATCKSCGGSFGALRRTRGKKTKFLYGCLYHHKRGNAVCNNSHTIRQDVMNHTVLTAISEALEEDMLEKAVEKALQRLRSGQEHRLDRRLAIERELSLIEGKEKHLIDAIERGEAVEPLTARLNEEEEKKKGLIGELGGCPPKKGNSVTLDEPRLKREAKHRVKDVRGLLHQHVPQARQILRKLIVGRLECEPVEEQGQRGYRITGQGTYGRFLPPTLVQPWWCPRHDSNVRPAV